MKILFTASEAYPLVKTGGLGDVAGTLPAILSSVGADVRLMLPGYPDVMDGVEGKREIARYGDPLGVGEVLLIEGRMPHTDTPVIVVDCPPMYHRMGGPYIQDSGEDWPDNHLRFALFAHAAVHMCEAGNGAGWSPDIVHGNDWQSGLIPAYMRHEQIEHVKTVFTVHNMQYQGVFDADVFPRLGLPMELFAAEGIEFYGKISFLKAGLRYSDHVTTVSPTYAQEILTPEEGFGLEGILQDRVDTLTGVLNGIDTQVWNPALDQFIAQHYTAGSLDAKMTNKLALQTELGLAAEPEVPLLGLVSRLTEQKGIDLVINGMARLNELGVQIVLLGTGEQWWIDAVLELAATHANVIARIDYDEGLSHRLMAGSDMFLMPSRFEPCGLTQMYAQRYGTLPVVRMTGGLRDTVIDVSDEEAGTGFTFEPPDSDALTEAVARAVDLYARKTSWRKIQQRAMDQDYTWTRAAKQYLNIYERL